jgi:hypothetical protein
LQASILYIRIVVHIRVHINLSNALNTSIAAAI